MSVKHVYSHTLKLGTQCGGSFPRFFFLIGGSKHTLPGLCNLSNHIISTSCNQHILTTAGLFNVEGREELLACWSCNEGLERADGGGITGCVEREELLACGERADGGGITGCVNTKLINIIVVIKSLLSSQVYHFTFT